MTTAEQIAALSIQDQKMFEMLYEAIGQYVENQESHVCLQEDPSEEDLRKLEVAEELQDQLSLQLIRLIDR